jgi:hypothetical protein
VSLFVERAQGIAPGFSMVDGDEAATVTEICQRLDGIPLAIELAASRMASMTASEMRDRLDHRFRLLVGSRRGLERHQTLRHAVQWSYDLLDDAEKALLERCSVFAGGFDLRSACTITGFDEADDYAILGLLDALVRKSLLVADRSSGRTRFSMLETIRQFIEEQLVARGEADEVRTAHARYFAEHETDIFALWNSPQQHEAYDWFATELANLRTAFRWASDQNDLDSAAAIVRQAGLFGVMVEKFEPITWAEELIEPARTVDHPKFVSLCAIASLCWMFGRDDDAMAYSDSGQAAMRGSPREVPFDFPIWLGAVYSTGGEQERWVGFYRRHLARSRDTDEVTRACLVMALANGGRSKDALSVATGLVDDAEATHNPYLVSVALLAYAMACREEDPLRALDAVHRGLAVARESGNRANETYLAMVLAITLVQIETEPADPLVLLDNIALAIRNYYEAANTSQIRSALAVMAIFLDRRGHTESAAMIAGFASVAPTAVPSIPEFSTAVAHLRDVLGVQTYESLARKGETTTTAEMVTYAYDQIDQARTELNTVSE